VVDGVEEQEMFRVKFPERGIFAFDSNGLELNIGDYCITEDVDDNADLGQVVGKLKFQCQKHSGPVRKIIRKATEEDRKSFEESERKEVQARDICRAKIKDRELPMKLVRTRYSLNGKKITFYFTSERRVDFRELVKDLAYIFKRRIELRQIGVRDETKMLGGFGCCGRQLCCASFLNKLGRLSIKMAKEQDMTLTPSKISGVCGRLLCCLQYENEWYHEVKEAMPQPGSVIKAKGVSGVVEELDLFRGVIKVRKESGELVEIGLEDLQKPRGKKGKNQGRNRNRPRGGSQTESGGTGNE
jgi:cell fate regulator YaaT (PSP1 superfamily)